MLAKEFSLCIHIYCVCMCVCVCVHARTRSLSCVQLFVTPWKIDHQAPLYVEFSRQEYWSGLPFPLPADLPDPEIEPASPALAGEFFTTEPPGKPHLLCVIIEYYMLHVSIFPTCRFTLNASIMMCFLGTSGTVV